MEFGLVQARIIAAILAAVVFALLSRIGVAIEESWRGPLIELLVPMVSFGVAQIVYAVTHKQIDASKNPGDIANVAAAPPPPAPPTEAAVHRDAP